MDLPTQDFLSKPIWMWASFLVVAMPVLDPGVLHRKHRDIGVRESLLMSLGYSLVAAKFSSRLATHAPSTRAKPDSGRRWSSTFHPQWTLKAAASKLPGTRPEVHPPRSTLRRQSLAGQRAGPSSLVRRRGPSGHHPATRSALEQAGETGDRLAMRSGPLVAQSPRAPDGPPQSKRPRIAPGPFSVSVCRRDDQSSPKVWTGPESLPCSAGSRSTNSMIAMAALSPWRKPAFRTRM